jgi:Domain of unknown function (DUF3883)/SNF2-related domain
MASDNILHQLTEGTILAGPHWTEPVKVLTAKARGSRIEVQAVGTHTKRLWTKLLKPEEFHDAITVTSAGALAALDGNPTHFRLAAEAHRIRLAFQYDPHFAVSVSQVDPLPHQMDAVYNHLLIQPCIRFLLADDPGAGKTIMAGLPIKELKFRGLVERTLIITPANLTDQWRRELHDKFREAFSVVNRATINAAYGRNVWEDTPQCITSVDFVARQDDILQLLRDVHFDLCIVDEAHKMAAYRYGTKVNKTQRYELGEFLRDHTDHYLFLTATPHKGDPDNFTLLLQLLDPDLYATGHILAEASAHNENRIMVRRLKEDMTKFDGSPCFPLCEEIAACRQHELRIKEKYVRKSLQFLIGESIQKLAQYDAQLRQRRDENNPQRLNIQGNRAREEARRNELSQRLKDRLAEMEQEAHLSEKPPEVVGVALILPAPQDVVASMAGMESDPAVEKIAVDIVMQYEGDQGRKPVSVEEENCGWDVTSLHGGQVARYIEVKGRAGDGGVALTPNEWIKAQRFGADYWLYVVVHCKTNPQLYLIQDPASKLHPKEEVSVVRYMVGQGDWQQAAGKPAPVHHR